MIEASKLRAVSTPDLRVLNQMVVEELRSRQRIEAIKAQTKFHVGQKVKFFSPKRGRDIVIEIQSFGPKNVKGKEVGGFVTWTVTPTLLQPA